MNIVTIIFGWLMATLLGAIFHLWRDGGFWKLLLYLGLSWAGFWLGNWAAGTWGATFLVVGGLNLGLALIGGLIFLFVGHWVSQIGAVA
jgi:hypothetical protein